MVSTSPVRNAEGCEIRGRGETRLSHVSPALRMSMLMRAPFVLVKLFINMNTSHLETQPGSTKKLRLIGHGNDAVAQFPKRGGKKRPRGGLLGIIIR